MDHFAVIMPAAGKSTRFGGPRNKLREMLAGRTVLEWSVQAFLRRKDVSCVAIAQEGPAAPEIAGLDRVILAPGGRCRAESVLSALKALPESVEWVGVHDAARPLVSDALIDRTFAAAREHGAAVPALPVHLTVKQADGPLPAKVQRTLPRHTLWAMQTPQMMRRSALLSAYEKCALPLEQVTDDVQLLELCGQDVWLVEGEERNLKITTPADLKLAKMFLAERR